MPHKCVTNPVHLIASHCKPWRDSTNVERLEGKNGLLLTPSIDHLFDRGFIGFEGNGEIIVSPVAHRPSLERMGVRTNEIVNVGSFTSEQKRFLEFSSRYGPAEKRSLRMPASNSGPFITESLHIEELLRATSFTIGP